MISIWEKQSFLEADILVVGAGITGLSAAASLKEKNPNLNITVLEKGVLPTGASTKNAGFACFGSASELQNDLEQLGEEGMLDLVEMRWKGLEKTIDRLGTDTIDLQPNGGYELVFDIEKTAINHLNELLNPLFKRPVFSYDEVALKRFQFGGVQHLIKNQFEAQLDTGKLISALWKYCTSLGINVHTGMEVESTEETENGMEVRGPVNFRARQVAICTNAFTKQFLPDLALSPGRGQVLLVQPSSTLPFKGTFHYDEGYYYFRDYYGKIIFGGGRKLDLQMETTTSFGINQAINRQLKKDLTQIIIPNQSYQIEMAWSGIMAFGPNKQPVIERLNDKLVIGVRLGGMGVALGSLVGEKVADLIIVGLK